MWSPPRVARAAVVLTAIGASTPCGVIGCGPAALVPAQGASDGAPGANGAGSAPSVCAAAKDPLHPVVAAWPARAGLASRAKDGLVLVRYEGCALEVLPKCSARTAERAGSTYAYSALSPARRAVSVPADPALLGDGPAKIELVATGQRIAPAAPAFLEGEGCERATHWIRRVMLGVRAVEGAPLDACTAVPFATIDEAERAGCADVLQVDLAPLEHVEGSTEIFAAGFGAGLGGEATEKDARARLREQYLRDRASLDRILARPDADVAPLLKAAYQRELEVVYGPREAELRESLGAEWKPLATAQAPVAPARAMGRFRVVADGGLDAAQLAYTGSGSGDVLPGGYAGLTLSLPQIPVPGVGLSLRGRFAAGPDISRVQIGAGVQFLADSGSSGSSVAIGLHASYGYLLSANCDAPEEDDACAALSRIVATSDGGGDIRASVAYEYLGIDWLILTAGGDVGFAFYPYTRENDEGDVAKGLVFALSAGLGLRL